MFCSYRGVAEVGHGTGGYLMLGIGVERVEVLAIVQKHAMRIAHG